MKTASKGVAVLLMAICAVVSCAAQDKLRRIEQPPKFTYSDTPIEVAVHMDGKLLADREVQAGPDWLRRISLEVTNTSGKDIKSLWINLTLREPPLGVSKPSPEIAGIVIPVELRHSDVKVLLAGSRITLKPPATIVDYWTKYALEHGMSDIEKVILDIRQVGFTDDTLWTRGRLSRKDPESGRYLFVIKSPEYPTSILIPKVTPLFFSHSASSSANPNLSRIREDAFGSLSHRRRTGLAVQTPQRTGVRLIPHATDPRTTLLMRRHLQVGEASHTERLAR